MNQAAWDLHLENVELRRQLAAKDDRIQLLEKRLGLAELRLQRCELRLKGKRK